MCELLALNANTPTDLRFSFHGLTRRGGVTGDHADGWGLATYDPDGLGVQIYREDAPAAFSAIAAGVGQLELKAHCSIAHIRKATQGQVSLANCHPFHRRWQGQEWVFAHNGDLKGRLDAAPLFPCEGSTDSEAAFCLILQHLQDQRIDANNDEAVFRQLLVCARRFAAMGTFNCLISNGHWLFAHANTKLHRITRRAPFRRATLADDDVSVDFSELTDPEDVVTIVSTEPLTSDEVWTPIGVGEAVLLSAGEIVLREQPAG